MALSGLTLISISLKDWQHTCSRVMPNAFCYPKGSRLGFETVRYGHHGHWSRFVGRWTRTSSSS